MRDPAPHAYQLLPGAGAIRVVPTLIGLTTPVFVIECSDIDRPGLASLDKQFVVNIDHHSTTELFGTINWIDSTAAACGEMIYNLCKATGVRVTKEIAECVYTALLTDTGSFHYSNTTERTLRLLLSWCGPGSSRPKLPKAIFGSYQWPKIELLGHVLATARRDETGQVAWMWQTIAMQEQSKASEEDADGFVNYPLAVGEVEATALFKETSPGVYRTSLRSKGDVNVAKIAEQFGGGGHRNAAGCTLKGQLRRD
jgi:phosphoesterase RecJ-like protein